MGWTEPDNKAKALKDTLNDIYTDMRATHERVSNNINILSEHPHKIHPNNINYVELLETYLSETVGDLKFYASSIKTLLNEVGKIDYPKY